jgi:hypothetical protein
MVVATTPYLARYRVTEVKGATNGSRRPVEAGGGPLTRRRTIGVEPRRSIVAEETLVSLLSWIKRTLTGAPDASAAEPPPRHERREAGRERHRETGEPAWEESDRLDDPPGTGNRNPDAAPEILGDV